MDKKLLSWLEALEATPLDIPDIEDEAPETPATPKLPAEDEEPTDQTKEEPTPVDPEPEQEGDDTDGDSKEDELELLDFDDFREEYIDLSVNAKPDDLLDKLDDLQGIIDLGPKEKKFVSDNLHILLLMKEQEIYEASRKLHHIEDPLDLIGQLSDVLNRAETLRDVILKLPSFFGMKPDLYRKFFAALIGGVQIGGGGTVEDVVLSPTKGQRLLFSTRFYTLFGSIHLVPWSLGSEDADLYLRDAERERMEKGSPEEKKILLKRVFLQSISQTLEGRVFVICVVNRATGKRTDIAIRLDQFLTDGYERGILQVDIEEDPDVLVILPTGEETQVGKLVVRFVNPDEPNSEAIRFLELKQSMIHLVADEGVIEDAINSIGAGYFSRNEYEGTPEELETTQKCVPTLQEMLLKRC